MNNINVLQNVVVDTDKISALVKKTTPSDLKQLLDIKDSQVSNLRKGSRRPSANGLLRLMMLHNVNPSDLATIE